MGTGQALEDPLCSGGGSVPCHMHLGEFSWPGDPQSFMSKHFTGLQNLRCIRALTPVCGQDRGLSLAGAGYHAVPGFA